MKKVALIFTSYINNKDGISVYIENITKSIFDLLKKGKIKDIYIDIFLPKNSLNNFKKTLNIKDNLLKNINFHEMNNNKFFHLLILHKKLYNENYNLIFSPNVLPIFSYWNKNTIIVVHDLTFKNHKYLSTFKKLYIELLLRNIFKFEIIGYISDSTLNDLKKYYTNKLIDKKLIYLPNGIPFKVKKLERPNIKYIQRKYSSKNLKLIFVGRLNKHKGLDRLIKFAKFLDKEKSKINAKFFETIEFHIVGKETEETKEIIKNFYFKNIKLNFHGYLKDEELNKLYKESHFCFFLSRNEGYGLPLVEALWLKTIPILSDIPVFREIMGNDFPIFNDENLEKDIYFFIKNIFENENYRKEILSKMEKAVEIEKDGYKIAAQNLLNYLR